MLLVCALGRGLVWHARNTSDLIVNRNVQDCLHFRIISGKLKLIG